MEGNKQSNATYFILTLFYLTLWQVPVPKCDLEGAQRVLEILRNFSQRAA